MNDIFDMARELHEKDVCIRIIERNDNNFLTLWFSFEESGLVGEMYYVCHDRLDGAWFSRPNVPSYFTDDYSKIKAELERG